MHRAQYEVSALCLLSIGTFSINGENVVKDKRLANYLKESISVVTFSTVSSLNRYLSGTLRPSTFFRVETFCTCILFRCTSIYVYVLDEH
jgi:hypothetical protein